MSKDGTLDDPEMMMTLEMQLMNDVGGRRGRGDPKLALYGHNRTDARACDSRTILV